MSADRRVLSILLAALDMNQREFAELLGYRPGHVSNVFNGCGQPSDAFKRAFGDLLADLILGKSQREQSCRLPAAPLTAYLRRRAEQAVCKSDFFADLGLSATGWATRKEVPAALVDRVCCELGIHPSEIYDEY